MLAFCINVDTYEVNGSFILPITEEVGDDI